ncbi:MAG TPA: glycosyltransferase family 4 protein [Bacteroidales bacterium]|nr:glycosyltransferase family 4 protein [Bacteroidales bacterium]
MKILILSNKPPYPPKDGGAIAIFNLAKGLADAGHFVHILSMNTSKHQVKPETMPLFSNIRFSFVNIDTSIQPVKALFNLLFSSIPYNAERFISKYFLSQLKTILQADQYNVVQLEGPYLGYCIPLIRKYSNAKIVIRAHNIECEIWERSALQEKNILKKLYLSILSKRLKLYEKNILQQCDIILPISSRDNEHLKNIGICKPGIVVPVGIDINNNYNHHNSSENSILYIGALDWMPNQEGILWFINDVWPIIQKKEKNVILHIAGRNAPEWLVKKLSSVKNLLFYGEIENSHNFIKQHGIMIVPLFSGSGMRVKIIEGMALAKAIVTTPVGCEGIDAENGKHLFITDKAETYAEHVLYLLHNNAKAEEMGNAAFEFVGKEYSNQSIISKLTNFYNQTL